LGLALIGQESPVAVQQHGEHGHLVHLPQLVAVGFAEEWRPGVMQREDHAAGARAGGGGPSQVAKSAGEAGARAFALDRESDLKARVEGMPDGGPEQPQSHDKE